MPNVLQGDPPAALAAWFAERGSSALKDLLRATNISPPTLRKVYRSEPVRADIALRLAAVLGCDHTAFTDPPPVKTRNGARKARARGDV
jgi:hypothetical protein